jgi:hypothetical protein
VAAVWAKLAAARRTTQAAVREMGPMEGIEEREIAINLDDGSRPAVVFLRIQYFWGWA